MIHNQINIKQTASVLKWFVLFVLVLFSACKTDLSKIQAPEDIKNLPQLSVENYHAFYKISSALRAEAIAPMMNKYTISQNFVEFPDSLEVNFYDDFFQLSTSLTCEYGIYYPNDQLWKFSGDVVIRSVAGGILKTQELYFNQKEKKLYSIKYVEVMDTTGSIIRGKGGFESNYNFTIYEFKNVDGVLNVQNADF